MAAGVSAAELGRRDELGANTAQLEPQTFVRVADRNVPTMRSGPLWTDHAARIKHNLGVPDLVAFGADLLGQAQDSGQLEDIVRREPQALAGCDDHWIFWSLYRLSKALQAARLTPEQLRLVGSALTESWQLAKWSGSADRERALAYERERGGRSSGGRKRQGAEDRWRRLGREVVRAELAEDPSQPIDLLIEALRDRQDTHGDLKLPKKKILITRAVEGWVREFLSESGRKLASD